MSTLPDVPSSGTLSKAALGPCPNPERSERLDSPPVHIAPVRRQMRELAQALTPLAGLLDDIHQPRSLHEWAWFWDELGDRAEAIQSAAMGLKHMADVMWERNYHVGRD